MIWIDRQNGSLIQFLARRNSGTLPIVISYPDKIISTNEIWVEGEQN